MAGPAALRPKSNFAMNIRKQGMLQRRRMRMHCSSNSFRGTLQTNACTWKVYLAKQIEKILPNTTHSILCMLGHLNIFIQIRTDIAKFQLVHQEQKHTFWGQGCQSASTWYTLLDLGDPLALAGC